VTLLSVLIRAASELELERPIKLLQLQEFKSAKQKPWPSKLTQATPPARTPNAPSRSRTSSSSRSPVSSLASLLSPVDGEGNGLLGAGGL
jgi:hypothetical protein